MHQKETAKADSQGRLLKESPERGSQGKLLRLPKELPRETPEGRLPEEATKEGVSQSRQRETWRPPPEGDALSFSQSWLPTESPQVGEASEGRRPKASPLEAAKKHFQRKPLPKERLPREAPKEISPSKKEAAESEGPKERLKITAQSNP